MNPAFYYPTCVGLFICTPHMIEHCGVPSKISAIPWFSFIEDFCVGRIWILHCFHSLILNMFSFKFSTPLLNPLKKVKKLKTLAIIGSALYFLGSVMLVWKTEERYVLCWLSLNGIEWEMYSWCPSAACAPFLTCLLKVGPLPLSRLRCSPSRRTVGELWYTEWQHNKEAGKI